jgi:hypothetical protein
VTTPKPTAGKREPLDTRTLRAVARRLRSDAKSANRTHDGSKYDEGYICAIESYALFYEREARAIESRGKGKVRK